jgi:hypothetical protein
MPLHLSLPQASLTGPADDSVRPEDLAAWVARLPLDDRQRAGRALASQLASLNAQRVRITLRQDISEAVLARVQTILPALERQLADVSLPLPADVRAAAKLAEDLLTHLEASYKLLLVEQSRRLFGFASSGRALLPIQRTMMLSAQRLVLSYRVHASPPKGIWSEMHELYHFAARRGLSQRDLGDATGTPLSIYKSALLLAFADPLRLMPGELDLVMRIVNELGDRAHLGVAQDRRSTQGLFVIKPQRDLPGHAASKRHQPQPQTQDLVLGTLPVAETLLERIALLSNGGAPVEAGFGPEVHPSDAKDLLGRLVKLWGAVPNRRFNRLRTHARVELAVGLEEVWASLNRKATAAPGIGEWMVTNESPRGFALMHVNGAIAPVRVGEVVGLRSRDADGCHVCVVRWVLSDNPDHLELGLEELAPSARPAEVRNVHVEGSPRYPALLLPEKPEQNQGPSILSSLEALEATSELSVGDLQAKLRVRPTDLVERTGSVQVVAFDSID